MKKNILNRGCICLIALLLFYINAKATPIRNFVSIKGRIENCKKAGVLYYSFAPVLGEKFKDSAQVDAKGNFAFNISFPNRVGHLLQISYKIKEQTYITPQMLVGPLDDFVISWNCKKNKIKIGGPNGDGFIAMQKYYQLSRPAFRIKSTAKEARGYLAQMPEMINKDLTDFQQLYLAKKIDEAYFKYAKDFIIFEYADKLLDAIQTALSNPKLADQENDLKEIQHTLFERYPINGNICYSPHFYTYTLSFVNDYDQTQMKSQATLNQDSHPYSEHLNSARLLLPFAAYKYYALQFLLWNPSHQDITPLVQKYIQEFPEMREDDRYKQLQQK